MKIRLPWLVIFCIRWIHWRATYPLFRDKRIWRTLQPHYRSRLICGPEQWKEIDNLVVDNARKKLGL